MAYEKALNFEVIGGAAASTITWPATTLPQKLQHQGFSITPVSNSVRTKVESGPVYQRPRYSTTVETVVGSIIVTPTQATAFWTFYNTTLGGGSLRFNWKHPVSGVAAVCQFNTEEPPAMKSI